MILSLIIVMGSLVGCVEAETVNNNLTREAEQFQVYRRVVFFNDITGMSLLEIEGCCNIEADTQDNQLEVIVKVGKNEYYKHFLGLSDNVTYFVEQLTPSTVSPYYYKVIIRPEAMIPDRKSVV
jgi:hypothetical protein